MNEDAFIACRPRLFGIAYGMLGELDEAEDVLQDAWLRWHGVERLLLAYDGSPLSADFLDTVMSFLDPAIEVTLLGQTVNHYSYVHGTALTVGGGEAPQVGPGLKGFREGPPAGTRATSFADLLRRIHDEVPAIRRLRFVTSYPRDFGDDILAAMRDCPRICRYLHAPAQSGSDAVLARMNRGYTVAQYEEFVARVFAHWAGWSPLQACRNSSMKASVPGSARRRTFFWPLRRKYQRALPWRSVSLTTYRSIVAVPSASGILTMAFRVTSRHPTSNP